MFTVDISLLTYLKLLSYLLSI